MRESNPIISCGKSRKFETSTVELSLLLRTERNLLSTVGNLKIITTEFHNLLNHSTFIKYFQKSI